MMKITTHHCPNCGASVRLGENVLSVLCAYCGSQIDRVLNSTDESSISLLMGKAALRIGEYEEADIHFSEALRKDPKNKESWFCRALTKILKPHGNITEAISLLKASKLSEEEAIRCLSEITTDSLEFVEKCLKRYETLDDNINLKRILIGGALGTKNPEHKERRIQALLDLTEEAWAKEEPDKAINYLVQVLRLDNSRSLQNRWLMDLAKSRLENSDSIS